MGKKLKLLRKKNKKIQKYFVQNPLNKQQKKIVTRGSMLRKSLGDRLLTAYCSTAELKSEALDKGCLYRSMGEQSMS